ncbi:MAG: BtpA/SgcQ family protein [Deltaproteobacteria bacterium]|nr:MAG: BtpA/SgcQ family protein [Deltaproteobacteria bacterium]
MPLFDLARCALVGMVHVPALPGSPRWAGDMSVVLASAARDAEALLEGGCDALIVENMHDLPYLRGAVPPETVAAMTLATAEVTALGAPTGVQVLAGANREALAVALATGASFVRAEAFAYAHVADEGWLDASAGELLRARRALGAEVAFWADVKKKHAAHAVTADLSLADMARGSAFCGADVLIVTGAETGRAAHPGDVDAAREAELPVAVGSGIDEANAAAFAARADALIVGSWLKEDGDWRRPVDPSRVRRLVRAMQGA